MDFLSRRWKKEKKEREDEEKEYEEEEGKEEEGRGRSVRCTRHPDMIVQFGYAFGRLTV